MANPGDKLYKITGIRFNFRLETVQVEFDTFTVDNGGNNVPTGPRAVRLPWDPVNFDLAKASQAGPLAAEPSLAGFTQI